MILNDGYDNIGTIEVILNEIHNKLTNGEELSLQELDSILENLDDILRQLKNAEPQRVAVSNDLVMPFMMFWASLILTFISFVDGSVLLSALFLVLSGKTGRDFAKVWEKVKEKPLFKPEDIQATRSRVNNYQDIISIRRRRLILRSINLHNDKKEELDLYQIIAALEDGIIQSDDLQDDIKGEIIKILQIDLDICNDNLDELIGQIREKNEKNGRIRQIV